MLRDWHTPRGTGPAEVTAATVTTATAGPGQRHAAEARWRRGTWTPATLAALADGVAAAAGELAALPGERLADAWTGAVAAFRDPASAQRRRLDPLLAATTGLSPEGLAAGLEAVLGGVAGREAAAMLRSTAPAAEPRPVLVVLASNLPALVVQPLLPILARRRPAILKSPRAEPLFAAAFVAELARREPILGRAVAALTWPGGDAALEAPLLAAAGPILAYGDQPALVDLERRAAEQGPPGRLVPYGPKTSLAVVGTGVDAEGERVGAGGWGPIAAGLARDVALFDQRGCLSVAAVYVLESAGGTAAREPATALATALTEELAALARRWPPGPAAPEATAAVRQIRDEAAMRGLWCADLPLADGTVVVEPRPAFRPTPGLRTVRVHPVAGAPALEAALSPWRGRLQGAALAGLDGTAEARITALLRGLGVSRLAPPGALQSPDARWHNGGIDPLRVLA